MNVALYNPQIIFDNSRFCIRKSLASITTADGHTTTKNEVLTIDFANDAVACVLINDQNEIVLVRQPRYPAREFLWEIVAGKIDPGETPEQAVIREVREETGYIIDTSDPATFQFLTVFYPSPGLSSERIHLFGASVSAETWQPPQTDGDELIEVQTFTETAVKEMILSGEIKDGKTLIGLLPAVMV